MCHRNMESCVTGTLRHEPQEHSHKSQEHGVMYHRNTESWACRAGWTGSPRQISPGRTNLFLVIISTWAYLDVVVGLLHPRHGEQDLVELHPAPHLATLLAQHLAPHQLLHVPINHDARAHLHMGVRQKQMSLEFANLGARKWVLRTTLGRVSSMANDMCL